MKTKLIVPIVLALVLLAPLSAAQWGGKGSYEPDTRYDQHDGWMHLRPDTSPDAMNRQVYFNGFAGTVVSGVVVSVSTTFNPNSAALGTAFQSYPWRSYAILGFWKDCNNDGYIGYGDNGLFEYSAVLLTDKTICPASNDNPRSPTFVPVHNDGQWIHELIPIGYDDVRTSYNENPWNVNDTGARVWADWNLPWDRTDPTCPVRPQPAGTYRSTGGFLRWADCFDNYAIVDIWNFATRQIGRDDLGFGDAPRDRPDQSKSPLNQRNPWGEAKDDALVTAFDCTGTPLVVNDPTGQGKIEVQLGNGEEDRRTITYARDGKIVDARAPNPRFPTLNPSGSAAGTVNETEEFVFPGVYGDCNRANDGNTSAEAPYVLEGANEPTVPSGRTQTDQSLYFVEGTRAPDFRTTLLGRGYPDDGQAGSRATSSQGLWVGNSITSASRNPFLNRESLGPEEVTYVTYYAFVSPSIIDAFSLDMPTQDTIAFYGAEACSQTPSPFDCDEKNWWKNALGEDTVPRDAALGTGPDGRSVPYGVKVGQPYNLRDIDCYDASMNGARSLFHYGFLSGSACLRSTL